MKTETVAVVGLGYVGLPLAVAFANDGYNVVGVDNDVAKLTALRNGRSYLSHIDPKTTDKLVGVGKFYLLKEIDKDNIGTCSAIVVCVPTPLTENREPDLSYIREVMTAIGKVLQQGQLVVLESTTYPGTTSKVVREILEKTSGLTAGKDFFLAHSPERQDPGNPVWHLENTPKVVGGLTDRCTEKAASLYSPVVGKVFKVSSTEAAEMTKILENVYRLVNIALVNEIKILCDRLGIDVWEVIEAAASKPFGFESFKPGPGCGGHCIPDDPFYLTWRAREVGMNLKFIELAGEMIRELPRYVVRKTMDALNTIALPIKNSNILILGVAYKADVGDVRETPAKYIVDGLVKRGAKVTWYDQNVEYYQFVYAEKSTDLETSLKKADCIVVVTNHSNIDYARLRDYSEAVIVDTRNCVPKDERVFTA